MTLEDLDSAGMRILQAFSGMIIAILLLLLWLHPPRALPREISVIVECGSGQKVRIKQDGFTVRCPGSAGGALVLEKGSPRIDAKSGEQEKGWEAL